MFTTEKAKSGNLTLVYNNKFIHSRYNPVSEANTYFKTQNINTNTKLFILIGPGLGYLINSIKLEIPNAVIFTIHLDKITYNNSIKSDFDNLYIKDIDLFKELSYFISDFRLPEVKIIKWIPYTSIFPQKILEIEKIIQQFFQERKGSIYTIGNFGKTWFRNIFFNYTEKNQITKIRNINSTIVIAASGPSLSDSWKVLKLHRENFILAALPSSLVALKNEDIIPDVIFHTDPGFWAKEHLKSIPNDKVPIVMPLTASFEPKLQNPLILINQNSCIENFLLEQNILNIQAHGTVAGTAYLFFRKFTLNPIIFIGLDLCYTDVHEHVHPHSFDILITEKQNRISGYLNLLYQKQQINGHIAINNTKTNTAFSIYSGWFNRKDKLNNVYRYNASLIKTAGLNDISTSKLQNLLSKSKKSFDFEINNNCHFEKQQLVKLLEKIKLLLNEFYNNIDKLNMDSICIFFSNKSLLLEIFQYTSYPEIINLSHYYRTNINKSKIILLKIYTNSFDFISKYLERFSNG